MQIPHGQLNPDTLRQVIEEFITRSGSDHGLMDQALDDKVKQVVGQLESGKIIITFDEETGTCNIANNF